MVLFEEVDGGAANSWWETTIAAKAAKLKFQLKLFTGRKYVVRIRLSSAAKSGETAVMMT